MGATGWRYFVPYQEDIGKALQELRNDVCARRDFAPRPTSKEALAKLERQLKLLEETNPALAAPERLRFETVIKPRCEAYERRRPDSVPTSIQELLEQRSPSGTGTILDMDHISEAQEFAGVCPLPRSTLIEVYGTVSPTHDVVDQVYRTHFGPYKRWEGFYVVVYDNGVPSEIYFEGCSGD